MSTRVKTLVVDDELAVLESFSMILGLKDYEVFTARNQDEAVAQVKKEQIDIAFVDLRFFGKDIGLDILKALRESRPKVAVVIVTAYATEQTKQEAFRLGAMEYINKPFMMETIYQLVDRALEQR